MRPWGVVSCNYCALTHSGTSSRSEFRKKIIIFRKMRWLCTLCILAFPLVSSWLQRSSEQKTIPSFLAINIYSICVESRYKLIPMEKSFPLFVSFHHILCSMFQDIQLSSDILLLGEGQITTTHNQVNP